MADLLWYKNYLYKTSLKEIWEKGRTYYYGMYNFVKDAGVKKWVLDIFNACDLDLSYSGADTNVNIEIGGENDRYIGFMNTGTFTITAPEHCIALKFKNDTNTAVTKTLYRKDNGVFIIAESNIWNNIRLYFDDVGLAMDVNQSYLYDGNIESNRIYIENRPISTSVHKFDIDLNSHKAGLANKWNTLVAPPNFGAGNKNIQGVLSKNPQLAPTKPDGSPIETYQYSVKYNKKQSPYFWDLQDCRCFVCYSNFSGSDLIWGEDSVSTGGWSEQPYKVDTRVLGRDTVKTGSGTDLNVFIGITSTEQDSGKTGIKKATESGTTYYSWYKTIVYPNQKKNIFLYKEIDRVIITINDEKDQITVVSGSQSNNYSLDKFNKIILAKRDLISIQKAFDDANLIKFVLTYCSNTANYWAETVMMLPTTNVPSNFMYILYAQNHAYWGDDEYQNGVKWYAPQSSYLLNGINLPGYFEPEKGVPVNTWADLKFNRQTEKDPIVQKFSVTLPDIEYYDITLLLNTHKTLAFPRNLDLLKKNMIVTPKFKDAIEQAPSNKQQKYSFTFETPSTLSIDDNRTITYHHPITYELTVNNIQMINETVVGSSTVEREWKPQAFNMDTNPTTDEYRSYISTGLIVQDYIKWKGVPNWFEEFFIDFGSGSMGITVNDSTYPQSFTPVAWGKGYDPRSVFIKDGNNADFVGTCGVFGWNDWEYENMIPASTSINTGSSNPSLNQTWYASKIQYFWWGNYDGMQSLPSGYTKRGVQLGLTKGILINYDNINAIDRTTKILPKNPMPSLALIICDEYNLT